MVKSATLFQLVNINLDKQWFSCTDKATFVQSKPNFILGFLEHYFVYNRQA